MRTNYIERAAAIIAAIILLQTLYFKFTAHPDSVHIFSLLGIEPFGRIGIGVLELIAGCLLLYSRTSIYGAILGLGLMIGAISSHLLFLGIEVGNDNGLLFILASIVTISCLIILYLKRNDLLSILMNLTGRNRIG